MPLKSDKRRGQVVILVALCLTAMMGVVAIALDGGLLLDQKRRVQVAADATALAAADDLYYNYATGQGLDVGLTAKASALSTAAAHGLKNDADADAATDPKDANKSSVIVNIPPLSGSHVGQAGSAEVIITFYQQRNFSTIFGSGNLPVVARAVAQAVLQPPQAAGMLVLDPQGNNAFTTSGSIQIKADAPIIVNSNSSTAATTSGSASITGTEINITGNYTSSSSNGFSPTPHTGVQPTPDPLANLPQPDSTTMAVQGTTSLLVNTSRTISPGVYQGGINVSGSSVLTMQPGIYYIKGGGFTVSGSSSVIGSGVMIYNDPVAGGDAINISGTGTLSLTPPTSGPYQGITIFQRRNATTNAIFSGGTNANITGTFYVPRALVNISGSSSQATIGSQWIAYDLTVSGSATLNVHVNAGQIAPWRSIRFVE